MSDRSYERSLKISKSDLNLDRYSEDMHKPYYAIQLIINPVPTPEKDRPVTPPPLPTIRAEPIRTNPFGLRKAFAAFNRFSPNEPSP